MKSTKIKGILRHYLRWPLYLAILLAVMVVNVFIYDVRIGAIAAAYVAVYLLISVILYIFKRRAIIRDLVDYAMRFHVTAEKLAKNLEISLCLMEPNMKCIWYNNRFDRLFKRDLGRKFSITDAISEINDSYLPAEEEKTSEVHFMSGDCFYRAIIQRLEIDKVAPKLKKVSGDVGIGEVLYAAYIYDETEIVRTKEEIFDQRLDVGFLYIDNYEETIEDIDDMNKALMVANIEHEINEYMSQYDSITKKLEKDKFIFLFQHKYLATMQSDKFSILEKIKAIRDVEGGNPGVTISIGIGTQEDSTFRKRLDDARNAMDLALGRGGDQAVVKTKGNILYYGGRSVEQEKNTRVKARVKAHALRDAIETANRVIIMGHSIPDVDAIGSALGIYRIATDLGKEARIVVGQVTSALEPLLSLFKNNKDYPEDLFLGSFEASEFVGNGNGVLLVVVDVNRPSHTDEPALIGKVKNIVVIDHHRRVGDGFENPTLSYVEPFASSACEMVAEIVQYSGDEIKLKTPEADALYSGIMVDTNNFMNKPGVRTFEAVAFLRRSGAEIIRIRKMFRTDMREYRVQAEAIQNMQLFMNAYAIAPCNAEGCPDPTIVGARIANAFLDIRGIKASFVLTFFDGKIYISARSIDELNVQVVMEKLGGGGHINSAGAQLSGCTLEEAAEKVKEILSDMKREGDID